MSENMKKKVVSEDNLTRYNTKVKAYIRNQIANGGGGTAEPVRQLAEDVNCGSPGSPVYIDDGVFKECGLLSAHTSTTSTRAEGAKKLIDSNGAALNVESRNLLKIENGVPMESLYYEPTFIYTGIGSSVNGSGSIMVPANAPATFATVKNMTEVSFSVPAGGALPRSHRVTVVNSGTERVTFLAQTGQKLYNSSGAEATISQGAGNIGVYEILVLSASNIVIIKL